MTRHLSGHHEEIIDLQYVTPTDSLLALATNTESIRLVSIDSSSSSSSSSKTFITPNQKGFGDVAVLTGHSDIVICLDRDPSGCWLASGAKDNDARLWRIDEVNSSFTCWAKFTGHAESIGAIALPRGSPNSDSDYLANPPKFLLTGSQDRTIKRWDIPKESKGKKTLAPRAAYTRKAHDKDINSIDVSPDNSLFATASQDKTVKIWNLTTGDTLGTLKGHRRGVWSVKFAPTSLNASILGGSTGGKVIATGSGDKTVKLWSLTDYTCLKTFEGHSNSVLRTLFISNGLQIASSGGDGLVKIWDVKEGECSTTLDNHEDRVWSLTTSNSPSPNDPSILISGGADSVITIWKDITQQTITTKLEAQKAQVEQEQKLQNYIHTSDYRSAITLALALNHPGKLLSLLTTVTTQSQDPDSLSGLLSVDTVLASLSPAQLSTLLLRLRDWNTNARSAPVAQRILNAVLKLYPAEKFLELSKRRGGTSIDVEAVLSAIEAYTEKHYRRMEVLVEESYLVEFT